MISQRTSQTETTETSLHYMEAALLPQVNELLVGADAIGAGLCRDAIWASDRCNWLGPSMEPVGGKWRVVHKTFGADLYSGTAGIALFLAHLAKLTDERLHKTTAAGALRQALNQRAATPPSARLNFYTGWLGLAYTALVVGEILDEPYFLTEGQTILAELPNLILEEQGLDVLSGLAGAIPFLISSSSRFPGGGLEELALQCGERLLEEAQRTHKGWSWNTIQTPAEYHQRDLLGFSHGAGGIAWALGELYRFNSDDRFGEAVQQALAYERAWFDSERQNWPDFRALNEPGAAPDTPAGQMMAWCHGAPGVALSRLRLWTLTGDPICRQEAVTALETTLASTAQMNTGAGASTCLCHGQAGNAAILLYGADILDEYRYRAAAHEVANDIMVQYHETFTPYPGGVIGAGETPGLFLGKAGVGYFYLRIRDSRTTPPILVNCVG